MPRLFGLNPLGVIVSGLAFWMIGFVFYGVIFAETWNQLWGFSPEQVEAAMENAALPMTAGFLLSIFSAVMIGLAMKMLSASDMGGAIKAAGFLWIGFALPTLAYDSIYAAQPLALLAIDGGHLLVGYVAMAAIQQLMDGIGVKAES